jgi:hypothetical protein
MMCGEWQIFMLLTDPISVLSKLLPEVKDLHYVIKVKIYSCVTINIF